MKAKARALKPPSKPIRGTKGDTVPPINTLKFMETIGPTAASRKLGVSTTTLHKARKAHLVSKVIEVAATGELRNLGEQVMSAPSVQAEPQSGMTMVMLAFEASKKQIVEQFAHMIGATVLAK